jgi:hypothetical protein
MPRRLTFWDLLAISGMAAALCAVSLLSIYRGPQYGLPQNDKLVMTSRRIVFSDFAPVGRSDHVTIFRLDTAPTVFEFTGVMGDYAPVRQALCINCEAVVWTDPADARGRPFAWQIEVNGKMIASYPDVKARWISNEREADWLAPIAGAISLGFAVWAVRRRRQDRQDN